MEDTASKALIEKLEDKIRNEQLYYLFLLERGLVGEYQEWANEKVALVPRTE